MKRTILSLLLSVLLTGLSAQSELSIVSWNLRDFGKSRDASEIKMIAEVIRNADIVCVQEIVAKDPGGAKAVARLIDELNRMGSKWDYRISDPTQSSSPHKSERYAFLWKTSKVKLKGRPYLLKKLSNEVEREPYLANFIVGNEILTIIDYHACTHDTSFPERVEIKSISDWLNNKKFDNIIWAGDMNLEIKDIAFKSCLKNGFKSVLNGEKTSLKRKCKNGAYLSRSEDNILYKFVSLTFLGGEVLDFVSQSKCEEVKWKWVSYSDHLPIELRVKWF